jgi:hypothetical protein
VVVNRSLHSHADLERWLANVPRVTRLDADDRWALFAVSGLKAPPIRLGGRLTPAAIRVNRHEQDVRRLSDGDIESAWGPGAPQDGTEEVLVEFSVAQTVTAIVLNMGAFSFGFPRDLAIDVSIDGLTFETMWQSETSVATVRAALADPGKVPLTFDLGAPTARFVRLRQLGKDPVVPWWIAELEVHGR